jgi:hypothetical protein
LRLDLSELIFPLHREIFNCFKAEVRVKYRVLLFAAGLFWAAAWCDARGQSAAPPASANMQLDASMAEMDTHGSVFVPLDNWVYPALDRLHALGYVDSAFLGMRPWTRLSIAHMLERSADRIESDTDDDEARSIYAALVEEFAPDINRSMDGAPARAELESIYTQFRGISGTPLRDSFHLGQTIVDDYGRPYERGFNNYSGFSARAEAGRFSLYFRGETQHAPSAAGYSPALATFLSENIDDIPFGPGSVFATIPEGPIAAANDFRVMEANLSYHLLGHEVSFGKSDHWLGPDKGASMLWSNNAENIYDFEVNKIEPFRIPALSRVTGPFRYDFFVGALRGHTLVPNPNAASDPTEATSAPDTPNVINPGDPWVHMEKVSFKPTRDVEFGFDRLTVWGGKGHAPITLHSFLHSFFSFQNIPVNTQTGASEKNGRDDPGDRLGTFDFAWRLPYLNHWVTLYTDSLVHDDVSPISAPRRSGVHPGIYLARFPGFEHLDLRLEGANTDTPSSSGQFGRFLYWEGIEKQGPTNNGFLPGDWVGRQGKGGQAWLTYHLSPQEQIQFQYRNAKAASAFIPGGTTQNDFAWLVVKRVRKNFELRGWLQYERWKAPIYESGLQSDTTAALQLTWFAPEKH